MGFLNGRVTFTRYRISGQSPLPFGEEMLALAEQHVIGRHGATEATDGVSTGWAGGDHVLDLTFDLAKNVINDALHLAIRVDTDKIPSSLLRLHADRDRRPGQAEPERTAHQSPAHRSQGSRPAPRRGRGGRRPVPSPQSLPGPLGRPGGNPLRRHDEHECSGSAPGPLS